MGRNSESAKSRRFRDNLRALIKARGWTQRDAAKHLGLNYLLIRKYLNRGLANVTDENRQSIRAICKAFHVGKVELLWSRTLLVDDPPELESESLLSDGAGWRFRILLHSHADAPLVRLIRDSIHQAFDKLVIHGTNECEN